MLSETQQIRPRAVCLAVLSCLLLGAAGSGPLHAEEFSFAALNRNYKDLVQELEPFQVGPATILVRSPQHLLRLVSHSARLTPSAAGGLDALLRVEFQGSGQIEADIDMTGLDTTVRDALVVPRQVLEVRGRLSVAQTEGGFLVRALELQPSIQVQIESELAARLFRICRPMGLVLVSLDCRELERALTLLDVPLPQNESFFLADEEISPAEREALIRFLDLAEAE